MPADTHAKRFTIDEPTSRTVLVEQFCSGRRHQEQIERLLDHGSTW
jgi:hypothetical protein